MLTPRLRLWFVSGLLAAALQSAPMATAIDIGVSPDDYQQRLEAWGTSLAWMGHEIGGSSNHARRQQIVDLIFDPANGLGLNFVRYNIGADQNPDGPAISRRGAAMDGWVPEAPSDVRDLET